MRIRSVPVRAFLLLAFVGAAIAPKASGAERSLISVDCRELVSRADLDYNEPARRSEEGMPVGNGRMGSLVWTAPTQLKFQINRVDVFAADGRTVSFPDADSDFASGCGYVDISLVSAGEDVFVGGAFKQHLSLYDAVLTTQGRGTTARVLAWPHRDVLAVEIDDRRDVPEPIHIDLRMLRYQVKRITGRNHELVQQHAVLFQTAQHQATSILGIHETMLESSPASIINDEPIRIFNDWPKDWDAAFRLRARGAFIISSAFRDGKIPLVEIQSQVGGPCRLANPWSQGDVTVLRNGKKAETLSGVILTLPTGKGETIVLVPKGSEPARVQVL